MDFHFSDKELEIFKVIQQAAAELQFPVYVIGGYVRDKILNRPSNDLDFVCQGNGIELAKRVSELLPGKNKFAYFKNFGTASITYSELELEFVGARKESYRRESRKPIVEDGTLEDDQNRRDFTINAMGIDIGIENFGKLVDPFDGLGDIKRQTIRTPLEPDQTFSDDPLRMLRAIRFASQLDFDIDEKTMASIHHMSERLEIISAERITSLI